MNDDEWDKRRDRAILAAFQTGRPVFADTDGEMRYADGAGEPLADEVGVPAAPVPMATAQIARAARASYWAGVTSAVSAIFCTIAGVWLGSTLFYASAGVAVFSFVTWRRVRRLQLTMLKRREGGA